ncbi:MAG TPA: type I-E CRISPR-associated protein Cse2/CasB [Alphaproteobacteria bacterium]|nr:type I-E CRISPR-associated protein Cse2/CasB [Alphaproteobacteria bacterium]
MTNNSRNDALLKFLYSCYERDDRATIANLRCALRKNLKHRSWPLLARFGGIDDELKEYDHRAKVVQTIAGLFASHPAKADYDFGTACRKLMRDDEKLADPKDVGPVARRLQYLLASEREEICDRVVRMVFRMKAQDIAVNYDELYEGLLFWGDRIRNRWAGSFWNVPELAEVVL